MSTSLVLYCPTHGPDIEPFEVAGTKFCSVCVRDFFLSAERWPVRELKMTEIEVQPRPRRAPKLGEQFQCRHCDTIWEVGQGRACPKCGLDALEREKSVPHDKYAGEPGHAAAGWHPDDEGHG